MISTMERYYRASGAAPFGGIVAMLGGGALTALVVSLLYALLCFYNPFVYLTAVATFGAGAVVGWVARKAAEIGKVRNGRISLLVGGALGLLLVYLSWAWYVTIVLKSVGEMAGVPVVLHPLGLLSFLQLIAQEGAWEMFGVTPTGWGLYAVWLVEAVVLLGATMATTASNDRPFCETCKRWTVEALDAALMRNTDHAVLRTGLENQHYDLLRDLRQGEEPDLSDCLHVHLHSCPLCTESDYLTIKHVLRNLESGKNEKTERDVVVNLRIPRGVREQLQAV